jgi:hypothetical protein
MFARQSASSSSFSGSVWASGIQKYIRPCVGQQSIQQPLHISTLIKHTYFIRNMHVSSILLTKRSVSQSPGMIPDTRLFPPPSPGATEAILEARRVIFGAVQGNNQRSGRKALRATMSGRVLKEYYEPRLNELDLERVGVENPIREELFRAEEEKNRIGKTRIKGKMRGGKPEFKTFMKLADAEEAMLEPIDIFAPSQALPEAEVIDELSEEMTPQEIEWLHEALGHVAQSAETDIISETSADASGMYHFSFANHSLSILKRHLLLFILVLFFIIFQQIHKQIRKLQHVKFISDLDWMINVLNHLDDLVILKKRQDL